MRFLAHLAIGAAFLACTAGEAAAQDKGVWSGIGLQVSTWGKDSEWPLVVRLNGPDGGTIEYPSLGCSGTLSSKGAPPGAYRETITKGDCISGGTVRLDPLGDKRGYLWTGEGTTAPNVNASGILFPGEKPVS